MSAKDVIAAHVIWYMPNPDLEGQRKDAREDADAILSALDAAGYAVVPKEPTEAMRRAGESAPNTRLASHVWRAMLTAAKETP